MPKGGKVRSYPEDFKHIAIELALAGEKPISEIASCKLTKK
jgi:transposase-like protein